MKLVVFSFFFTAFIFAMDAVEASSKVEAILDSQVELSSKKSYSWIDLVRVTKANNSILKKLAEIKLSPEIFSSNNGTGVQSVARSRILKVIKNSELKDLGLLWQIPDTVEIKLMDQISASEIERRLTNQLQAQCDSCDVEVFVGKVPTLKARHWQINVTDLSIKNSLLIPLEADGKSLWVSVRIKAYKNVPVTTRLIPALHKIQQGDLELKRLDMAQVKDGFLNIEQMTGMMMNRSLSVGTPVGASDVKREAAIKKGQLVKILIENEDFEIQSNATAEESGFIGDLIKVKSSDHQKLIMGKIKDNNSVVIQ